MKVRCQDCGQEGDEDETDLMPNTCPACFDRRVLPIFIRSRSIETLVAGLIEAGCKPDRITPFIWELAKRHGLDHIL